MPISPRDPHPQIETFLAASPADLVARYAIGVEHFDRRMFDLPDDRLDMAFLPDAGVGNWPIRVLVGHLADAELAFVHRMRLVIAQENPILQAWDENAFIDSGIYGADRGSERSAPLPIGGPVATIHTLRKWTADLLRTLAPRAWERKGLHTVRGEQTLHTILAYDTWHLEHHAWFLNAKVERLLGRSGS